MASLGKRFSHREKQNHLGSPQATDVYPANPSMQASVEMAASHRQVGQSCDGSKAAEVYRKGVALLHLVGKTGSPGREPKGLVEQRRAGRDL